MARWRPKYRCDKIVEFRWEHIELENPEILEEIFESIEDNDE